MTLNRSTYERIPHACAIYPYMRPSHDHKGRMIVVVDRREVRRGVSMLTITVVETEQG